MIYNGEKYIFISHRHNEKDIINNGSTKLAIHKNFTNENTPVK